MGISYLFYVCSAQFAGSLRGMLMSKKSKVAYNLCYTQLLSNLEQGTGIEPASSAWEADVLPMYEPCKWSYHTTLYRLLQGENRRDPHFSPDA